jgi:sulfate adenylyltransferase subunit 1
LEVLENATVTRRSSGPWRFPVQLVSRSRFGPRQEQRGYLGRVESGVVAIGDEIRVWPSGVAANVADIVTLDGSLAIAGAGRSVSLLLDRQVDVIRGDLLTHSFDAPTVTSTFAARLCWLNGALDPRRNYLIKHGTVVAKAKVEAVLEKLDIHTLTPIAGASELAANDIGMARIKTARPLAIDRYAEVRATGSFLLVDEASNATVAGGMVEETLHA